MKRYGRNTEELIKKNNVLKIAKIIVVVGRGEINPYPANVENIVSF